MNELTEKRREKEMAKLIQICASQNDLFGLDAEGVVYRYNFNTNTWMRLGRGQRDRGGSPGSADGGDRLQSPHSDNARAARFLLFSGSSDVEARVDLLARPSNACGPLDQGETAA